MSNTRDELEDRLGALFREQAEATPVAPAEWTEARPLAGRRRVPALRLVPAAAVLVAVVALVGVVAAGGGDRIRVRTGPADDGGAEVPTTVAATPAFVAETPQVALRAGAVTIEAGGRTFSPVAPLKVNGDPGTPQEYTTLELTWIEHEVEMRLFVYFRSDGRDWWSDEIRTYDGRSPGEWITYRGDFFRRPLGTAFTGDFEVREPAPGTGRVLLADAHLEAFRRLAVCDTPGATRVLDVGVGSIEMPGPGGGYGLNARLLDARSCAELPDQDRYGYTWASADEAVVRVDTRFQPPGLGGRHVDLAAVAPGVTSVRVTATDPDTGAPVAELDIPVTVLDVAPPSVNTETPPPPPGVVTTTVAPPDAAPTAGDAGPVLRSATADLAAGTITVTFDRPVVLGPAPLAALYLVVYGADPKCTTPAGNSHEVISGSGTATLTLDATSLAGPTSYITLAPAFVVAADTGVPSQPLGCTPVPTT